MESRSVWHIVALIATLAVAALVAVVAVTKSDNAEPSAEETTTATPSATATSSPGLSGDGPFVVYAVGNEILAYDVAGTKSISLGRVEGFLGVVDSGRQPGRGRLVAFTMSDGNLWTVTRRGLTHALTIPSTAGSSFIGALTFGDDRRVAVASTGSEPSTVIADLQTKRVTNVKRTRRGTYPPEPLLPVGWGLGGTVLYEIPYCDCDDWSEGLFALDTASSNSTRVSGTSSSRFFQLAVAPSGQALYYGTSSGRCSPGTSAEACGPPYYLRRLAAGEAGSDIIRRASDDPFFVDAISPNGDLVLVHRGRRTGQTLELYSAEGERQPAPEGAPDGAAGVAILPGDVFVIRTATADKATLIALRNGTATTITEVPVTGETFAYLGWLL